MWNSTLGWYASRYWLFAREGEQIALARKNWGNEVYSDLELLYADYLRREGVRDNAQRTAWEAECKEREVEFWQQERQG